jgi:hypothetical protein
MFQYGYSYIKLDSYIYIDKVYISNCHERTWTASYITALTSVGVLRRNNLFIWYNLLPTLFSDMNCLFLEDKQYRVKINPFSLSNNIQDSKYKDGQGVTQLLINHKIDLNCLHSLLEYENIFKSKIYPLGTIKHILKEVKPKNIHMDLDDKLEVVNEKIRTFNNKIDRISWNIIYNTNNNIGKKILVGYNRTGQFKLFDNQLKKIVSKLDNRFQLGIYKIEKDIFEKIEDYNFNKINLRYSNKEEREVIRYICGKPAFTKEISLIVKEYLNICKEDRDYHTVEENGEIIVKDINYCYYKEEIGYFEKDIIYLPKIAYKKENNIKVRTRNEQSLVDYAKFDKNYIKTEESFTYIIEGYQYGKKHEIVRITNTFSKIRYYRVAFLDKALEGTYKINYFGNLHEWKFTSNLDKLESRELALQLFCGEETICKVIVRSREGDKEKAKKLIKHAFKRQCYFNVAIRDIDKDMNELKKRGRTAKREWRDVYNEILGFTPFEYKDPEDLKKLIKEYDKESKWIINKNTYKSWLIRLCNIFEVDKNVISECIWKDDVEIMNDFYEEGGRGRPWKVGTGSIHDIIPERHGGTSTDISLMSNSLGKKDN